VSSSAPGLRLDVDDGEFSNDLPGDDRAHRPAPVRVQLDGTLGKSVQHRAGMCMVVRGRVRAHFGRAHDRFARLDVNDASRVIKQRPGWEMHTQTKRVAVASVADLGLRPFWRVRVLARADLANVCVRVDPLRQRQRNGQPGYRI
jgi:hypothetical protein